MNKVKPNNENETKSDIFSWGIVKFNIIFHWSQNTKTIQRLLLLPSFNVIARVNTNK